MKKGVFVLVLCLVILAMHSVGFISAQSSVVSEFTIAGCEDVARDISIGLGKCHYTGYYYCEEISGMGLGDLKVTTTDEFEGIYAEVGACAMNDLNPLTSCCPYGWYCDEGGTDICQRRLIDCSNYTTPGECEANSCLWLDGECIEPNSPFLSCTSYKTKEACENDTYSLGKTGRDTEICGTSINGSIVPFESCRCEWNTTNCNFVFNKTPSIYGSSPVWFTCSRSNSVGECIDGLQDINWSAWVSAQQGYGGVGSVPIEERKEVGCIDGSDTFLCGEAVVQLPFFTMINLVFTLLFLMIFYIVFRV